MGARAEVIDMSPLLSQVLISRKLEMQPGSGAGPRHSDVECRNLKHLLNCCADFTADICVYSNKNVYLVFYSFSFYLTH